MVLFVLTKTQLFLSLLLFYFHLLSLLFSPAAGGVFLMQSVLLQDPIFSFFLCFLVLFAVFFEVSFKNQLCLLLSTTEVCFCVKIVSFFVNFVFFLLIFGLYLILCFIVYAVAL